MKSPLRVGAFAAPKRQFPIKSGRPQNGKARRIASLSAAVAMVVGVGAASAVFVDYLADRARAAPAAVAVKPLVAEPAETDAETKVAALALEPAAEPAEPVQPPETRIAAATPDAEAIAKVAVGPEHAIELPGEDPTESPIVQLDEIEAPEDAFFIDATVPNTEPVAADAEGDDPADETLTAAIDPEAAEAALDEEPVKKPKRRKAEQAKPRAVENQTDIASLPGVDVGGLAGYRSDDDENSSASTVRTVTKPATSKNLGGVPAGAARVTAAVKLRTGPSKGNGVAGVVPAGSAVNVLSCDGWCQVVYNGRTGWVYKNFLTGSKSQKKAAGAKPQKKPTATSAEAPAAPATRKATSSRL